MTVWALIFNDPTACEGGVCDETRGDLNVPEVQGSVFRVTGHVVSTSSSFGGHIAVGDAASAARGPGLLDPYGAQIHLIVREHGVAGTGKLLQQQFNDVSPRFCNVECADIQKSITPGAPVAAAGRAAISARLCPGRRPLQKRPQRLAVGPPRHCHTAVTRRRQHRDPVAC